MNKRFFSGFLFAFAFTAMQAQTATNSAVTATWGLTTGTGTETAAISPEADGTQFIASTYMTIGSELSVKAESKVSSSPVATTYDGYTQTYFMQSKKNSASSDDNAICFMLITNEGITFTPTKAGLKIARWLTDACTVDVSWVNGDGTTKSLATGITPNRNYNAEKGTGNIEGCSILDYEMSGMKANEAACGLRVNVYGMKTGKTVSIGDVYIEGVLNGTVGQPITFTLSVEVSPEAGGSVSISPEGTVFESGSAVTLSQSPNADYIFAGWYDEGDNLISSGSPYTLTMDGNKDITAKYVSKADLMTNDYYIIPSGDIDAFRKAIAEVNSYTDRQPRFIFLQNGIYDYGTYENPKSSPTPYGRDTIFADNVSIIGESMDSVIIQITPTKASVSNTSPIVVKGTGTYFQDLTLKNNFSYSGNDGQAAALQDDGHHTICKNVKLLSKQDTYYPHTAYGQLYWETSEIHGTVDFICGNGDVFFNQCRIMADQRYTAEYSGDTHLAAPYTKVESFDAAGGHGFIFDHCYIDCKSKTWDFGRGWRGWPKLAFLNSTLSADAAQRIGVDMTSGKEADNSLRFTTKGIQSSELPVHDFYEYNTMDEEGNVISPASNVLTFTANGSYTYETILTDEEAKRYALDAVYPDWAPDEECEQVSMTSVSFDAGILSWTAAQDSKAFLIEKDGKYVAIIDGTTQSYAVIDGTYTVRAANMRGGFGEPMEQGNSESGIEGIKASTDNTFHLMGTQAGLIVYGDIAELKVFDTAGNKVAASQLSQFVNLSHVGKGVYIVQIKTKDGRTASRKIMRQ